MKTSIPLPSSPDCPADRVDNDDMEVETDHSLSNMSKTTEDDALEERFQNNVFTLKKVNI